MCTCCFDPCVTYDRSGVPRTYSPNRQGLITWDGRRCNTLHCLRESDPRATSANWRICDYPLCLIGNGFTTRSCYAHPEVCVSIIQFPPRSLNFEKKTLVRQGNGWGGELRVEVSGRQVDQLVVWSDPYGGAIFGGESHTELFGRSGRERLETVPHSDLIIGTGSESITINARDITILDSSKSLEPRDDQEELMWEENPDRNHFEEKDDKLEQMLELATEKQDANLIGMVKDLQEKNWHAQCGFPSAAFIGDYATAVALLTLLKEVENEETVQHRAQRLYFIAHRYWKLLHKVCHGNDCNKEEHPECQRQCNCNATNPTQQCSEAGCRWICSVNTGATSQLFVCPSGYVKTQHLDDESHGSRYIQKVLELDESAVMVAYVSFFRNWVEENVKLEGTKIKMCRLLGIANCTVYGHSETLAYAYTNDHNIIDILKNCREWWERSFVDGDYLSEKVKNKKK